MELSRIIIGAMRYSDRENARQVLHAAIDAGFNYIDTSAGYCYKDDKENSEAWVGAAVREDGYRDKVMVSTKSGAGNGGVGFGDYDPVCGNNIRTVEQVKTVFLQSLDRMGLVKVDYYHLWACNTMEQFEEAMKPGGWYEGILEAKDKWGSLGITSHADSKTLIKFLETGKFSTVTMPFNVTSTIRLDVVDYARANSIKVIAMNPFSGGFLTKHERLKELALRYLLSLEGVHVLIGFTAVEEVQYAKEILDSMDSWTMGPEEILKEVDGLLASNEPRCTACGYCQPCLEGISVGECLSYYNVYKYLRIEEAKKDFMEKQQWHRHLHLDKCIECGVCEERCPNGLPVMEIIKEARKTMYG